MSASQTIPKTKVRRIVLAVAAVFLALTATAGAVSASASTVSSGPSFASQALSYGLSSAQVSTLQKEVNAYIAAHGGKQIAINEVASTGSSVVFVVPGRTYAYPVTSAATASSADEPEACPSKAFCTFQNANFEGQESAYYACGYEFKNTYNGSWKNDQSTGIEAKLWITNEKTGHPGTEMTCAAYCNDPDWPSYLAITDVEPC